MKRRELAWGAAAVLGSLALALAGAEAVLRATWGNRMPTSVLAKHLAAPDRELGWRLRPNADITLENPRFGTVRFRANGAGLREDKEIPYEKPEGERRIVALGDSFTYGQWVNAEDSYVGRIEAALPGWEVVNGGVFGYDADKELAWLLDEGLRYRPDIVIAFFCIDNDFFPTENLPSAIFALEDGKLARRAPGARARAEGVMGRRSWVMRNVVDRLELYWFVRDASRSLEATLFKRASGFSPKILPFARTFPDAAQRPGVDFTYALLSEMRRTTEAAGARFLLVAVEADAVQPDVWAEFMDHPDVNPADFDPERPERLLREFAERAGLAYAQTSDGLRRRPGEEHILREDGHYNALGHRRAAEAVLEKLAALGWAP